MLCLFFLIDSIFFDQNIPKKKALLLLLGCSVVFSPLLCTVLSYSVVLGLNSVFDLMFWFIVHLTSYLSSVIRLSLICLLLISCSVQDDEGELVRVLPPRPLHRKFLLQSQWLGTGFNPQLFVLKIAKDYLGANHEK